MIAHKTTPNGLARLLQELRAMYRFERILRAIGNRQVMTVARISAEGKIVVPKVLVGQEVYHDHQRYSTVIRIGEIEMPFRGRLGVILMRSAKECAGARVVGVHKVCGDHVQRKRLIKQPAFCRRQRIRPELLRFAGHRKERETFGRSIHVRGYSADTEAPHCGR